MMQQIERRNLCKTNYGMVTLVDGTRLPSDSEEWRFECEAGDILNKPTREERQRILYGEFNPKTQLRNGGLMKYRGETYVKLLEEKILELWRASRQ